MSIKYEHDDNHIRDEETTDKSQKKLLFAAAIIGLFMFVEVVGGVVSGSLALISDAGHMLSDFAALTMAAFAVYVSKRCPDEKRSYGYSRFPVLVAYSNALFMFAVIAFIVYSAIARMFDPIEIETNTMLLIAVIGLIVNIVAFMILHSGDKSKHDLNVRSAAIHVIGDMLGSIAAIIAAIVINISGWVYIDPLLSMLIAMLISYHAFPVLKKSAHILIQGAPVDIDIDKIKETLLEEIKELNDVDHIHLWYQDDQTVMSTMHIQIDNCSKFGDVKKEIRTILKSVFNIDHVTIEMEHA